MVDIMTGLAAYGAAQYVIPRGLGIAAKVKLAYDVGHWLGTQAAAGIGGAAAAPPAHNPGPQVDAFLSALGGAPKKRRKLNRYNILLKKEMAHLKMKGVRGKNLGQKDKFRLASKRAMTTLRKEKRDASKKRPRKKTTS